MEKHILKLVIPLTIISFFLFTKWWYALPVDAPHTMFAGFPLPFVCNGWHTSMSFQFFAIEFIVDLTVYFIFWLACMLLVDKFIFKIRARKILTIPLFSISLIIILISGIIGGNSDSIFYLKRDFDIDVIRTGYKFVWQPGYDDSFYKNSSE